MTLYYAGITTTSLLKEEYETLSALRVFTKIPDQPRINDVHLDFNYMLFWKDQTAYFAGCNPPQADGEPCVLRFFERIKGKVLSVATSPVCINVATDEKEIWDFSLISGMLVKHQRIDLSEDEHIAKILSNYFALIILTTKGNVIRFPKYDRLNTDEKSGIPLNCTDVAMGVKHILLLHDDGRVFTFGSGERASLGHHNLDSIMFPKAIKALLEVKIIKIAASGWLSAAISDKGDLYLWGWNKFGEIEPLNENRDNILFPVPYLVKIQNKNEKELKVKEVQCGIHHIIALTEDGTFWGSGSNKYGQLGKLEVELGPDMCTYGFVKLDMSWLKGKTVRKFICKYDSSVMIVE